MNEFYCAHGYSYNKMLGFSLHYKVTLSTWSIIGWCFKDTNYFKGTNTPESPVIHEVSSILYPTNSGTCLTESLEDGYEQAHSVGYFVSANHLVFIYFIIFIRT